MSQSPVGNSGVFVLPLGYKENFGPFTALVDAQGKMRVFFRVHADPDNPHVRPGEAWGTLLKSLPYNTTVRFLLSWWLDETQRLSFVENVQQWGEMEHPERKKLYDALLFTATHTPLPFGRTVVLEFVVPEKEKSQWLLGIPELLSVHGLSCFPMAPEEIEVMAQRIFNPEV